MNYKKIFDDSFSTLTPLTVNEEIIRNVTERAEKMEKKKRISINKPVIAVCAAVAAVAVGTISVGAASGWNLPEIIHSWFGGNESIAMENLADVTAENITDNFSKLDFEIKGAISDDNITSIFMEVTRTDGRNFDCGEYHALDENGEPYYHYDGKAAICTPVNIFSTVCNAFVSSESEEIYRENELYEIRTGGCETVYGIKTYEIKDTDPSDNKITVAVCIDKTEIDEKTEYIELELSGFKSQRYIYSYENGKTIAECDVTETINGFWNAEIFLDFEECEKTVLNPDEIISLDFYNHASTLDSLRHEMIDFTLTELIVSPISVGMNFEAPLYDEIMYQYIYDIGEVVMKDGEVVKFGKNSDIPFFIKEYGSAIDSEFANAYYERGDKWIFNNKYMLEKPIDINQIDYVEIGNKVFEF